MSENVNYEVQVLPATTAGAVRFGVAVLNEKHFVTVEFDDGHRERIPAYRVVAV